MSDISARDLWNYGGHILDRVAGGESMTITRDGTPVALLCPLPAPRRSASALLERWKNVPVIDADFLRDDIAQIIDVDL
jgi:antitoxin (DNA-binding transcriptional repressor) of toxin-antitoxin stability system